MSRAAQAAPARGRSSGSRAKDVDGIGLAAIAHDLRTPLNSIKSWTHVLEIELRESSPGAKRALQGILAGVEAQVRLIEELLERPSPRVGSSGRREDNGEADSLDKTTRRGER